MDTQNTSIHIRHWGREFWFMSFANLLLTLAICMQAICMPESAYHLGMSYAETSMQVAAYAVGLYLLGPFCNYLTQTYRRNKVCLLTMAVFGGVIYAISYFTSHPYCVDHNLLFIFGIITALLMGMTYGLSQMLFTSTLVIDKCESFMRTEANHHVSWMGRIGLSLGCFLAVSLGPTDRHTFMVAVVSVAIAIVLLMMVRFPFKSPEDDVPLVSLDRFFLPRGFWLFLNLLLITMIMGLLLSTIREASFYLFLLGGFALAMLAERFAFADADLKSEAVTGLISLFFALLLLMWRRDMTVVHVIAPVMVGFGIGIIGSRFLLFFIKLSEHCQRGTSQSTFVLAWETGISLGLALGVGLFHCHLNDILTCAMALAAIALALYVGWVHGWYLSHKSR